MRRLLASVLACLLGFHPAAIEAGRSGAAGHAAGQSPSAPPKTSPAQDSAPADSLVMSFDRIKRDLRILPPSTAATPLKLEYYVEVQALLPPIPIFKPGELTTGLVPFGAPTHADMMAHVTPLAFRSPAIPVSAIMMMGVQMLVQWEANRAREERLAKKRQDEIDAERERQRRLKESIVIAPPK
jgi:hypothetical protein